MGWNFSLEFFINVTKINEFEHPLTCNFYLTHKYRYPRITVYSTMSLNDKNIQCMSKGFQDFISKSVSFNLGWSSKTNIYIYFWKKAIKIERFHNKPIIFENWIQSDTIYLREWYLGDTISLQKNYHNFSNKLEFKVNWIAELYF